MSESFPAKPPGPGASESLGLDDAASHLLDECRMVLPGIQALFGFQLIAVFNDSFATKLTGTEQGLHLVSITLVALSGGLVMTPAAVHRQTDQKAITERFIWLASWLLLMSMPPLAVGLSLDVYLIARLILHSAIWASGLALVVLLSLCTLWLVVPRIERRYAQRSANRAPING